MAVDRVLVSVVEVSITIMHTRIIAYLKDLQQLEVPLLQPIFESPDEKPVIV